MLSCMLQFRNASLQILRLPNKHVQELKDEIRQRLESDWSSCNSFLTPALKMPLLIKTGEIKCWYIQVLPVMWWWCCGVLFHSSLPPHRCGECVILCIHAHACSNIVLASRNIMSDNIMDSSQRPRCTSHEVLPCIDSLACHQQKCWRSVHLDLDMTCRCNNSWYIRTYWMYYCESV